ncbi:MAG: acyl-CoA dehydrogenase [Actinobacteria bacterium]|nr:acyl-CoA dehydrogenase [Acidimicrobiia bacterium]PHX59464.1 MAG: acyl-CoA dehydrogenase [Actinomycetota bacterium]
MSIDFSLPDDVEAIRLRVRDFIDAEVRPAEEKLYANAPGGEPERRDVVAMIIDLREKAKEWEVWLPHMPVEWGGLGLGPTAMAFVSAEAARTNFGPFILNAQAPDEGNQHTLLHHATPDQKERYLRPLLEGRVRSCFAMTEPEVSGSDPTGIQTSAVEEANGDWLINGHKWYISGARGAKFAILIAKTDPEANPPQASNTAFLVDLPAEGWEVVRDIDTMAGAHNHCEIRITNLRVPAENILGGRGNGHLLGQARLGPARLAHCMRWIAQIETALELMVTRAESRQLHGAPLADKQAIQWMMADSAMELYAAKLMVLHAAYRIENDLPFRQEVSFAKHHVANTLWRVVDRAIQVHGALGYSTDTPLEKMLRHARAARLVDGADEVHQALIARNLRASWRDTGSLDSATGTLSF